MFPQGVTEHRVVYQSTLHILYTYAIICTTVIYRSFAGLVTKRSGNGLSGHRTLGELAAQPAKRRFFRQAIYSSQTGMFLDRVIEKKGCTCR
jgi:hypothetical protein